MNEDTTLYAVKAVINHMQPKIVYQCRNVTAARMALVWRMASMLGDGWKVTIGEKCCFIAIRMIEDSEYSVFMYVEPAYMPERK